MALDDDDDDRKELLGKERKKRGFIFRNIKYFDVTNWEYPQYYTVWWAYELVIILLFFKRRMQQVRVQK